MPDIGCLLAFLSLLRDMWSLQFQQSKNPLATFLFGRKQPFTESRIPMRSIDVQSVVPAMFKGVHLIVEPSTGDSRTARFRHVIFDYTDCSNCSHCRRTNSWSTLRPLRGPWRGWATALGPHRSRGSVDPGGWRYVATRHQIHLMQMMVFVKAKGSQTSRTMPVPWPSMSLKRTGFYNDSDICSAFHHQCCSWTTLEFDLRCRSLADTPPIPNETVVASHIELTGTAEVWCGRWKYRNTEILWKMFETCLKYNSVLHTMLLRVP